MLLGNVDIPDELLDAQGSGKLVIFAGAGVSMREPSNLPSFKQLAFDAAKEFGLPYAKKHDPDKILGRLEDNHPEVREVREYVRRRFSSPNSQPNRLHQLLAQLALITGAARIVTTNFDAHLSTALGKHSGLAEYVAPALPRGDNFLGVVYLHGKADSEPDSLVFTDRDFGRAYLTDGWARRFMVSLFQAFTVLFVGYSHNDVVLQYLARWLLQGCQR
ncbi:MAG: SIR2 family protein, partial [bacterium]